jgi:transglutaminase-like putative cysteine protease
MYRSAVPFTIRPPAWRPKRPMSRDKADTLLLLTACVLVLAPHTGHLPWWTSFACAALLMWRGWITFRGNRMPSRWLLLPISVLAMGSVYFTYKTLLGREAGVTMLVLLLAFKLLEMRARRDLFAVIFLCFFLILTSFFYSQTIGTAVLMVAALILLLTAQLSFQYTGAAPPLTRRLALSSFIFVLAVPLALVLFILFPRIQGPLWGLPGDAQAGRSGLSDNMAPGKISKLALSGDIAFRVLFNGPLPRKSALYWRGPVLGNYDGRNWTPLRSRANPNRPLDVRPRGAPVGYQVTLEPNGQRWLFGLEMPAAPPQVSNNPTRFTPDMQIVARQPVSQRLRYDASSFIDFDLQPNETSAVLQDWLKLPSGYNPKTLLFAEHLRSQHGKEADRVNAALRFFREEKFSYTLEPPALGQHEVDDFLFSTRAGFCEHYASAFVVLMRALNIPARVVTGYQGGEINAVDGFMIVRQSDAHAWAEVWLKDRGWIRVDPTSAVAPDRIERNLTSVIPPTLLGGLVTLDGGDNSWLTRLHGMRHKWDAVTNSWNQWVLNYTPERQRNFIQSLGFDNVDWRTLTILMFGLGATVIAAVALPLIRNRPNISPLDKLYSNLCAQMARHGCARAIHEGPRTYRMRLAAEHTALAPDRKIAATRFLDLYEAIRYGTLSTTGMADKTPPVLLTKLRSLLADCR